jgi:hypothetical protein
MNVQPPKPDLLVTFPDGAIAGWHDGYFFGDDSKAAMAILRCEALFFFESELGLSVANQYSIEGALVALIGSKPRSQFIIVPEQPINNVPMVLAAGIGAWHE